MSSVWNTRLTDVFVSGGGEKLAAVPPYRATGEIRARHATTGAISWSVIVASVIGILVFPRTWVLIATVFLGYFLLRMLMTFTFAVVGDRKIASWSRRDWIATEQLPGDAGISPADVYHAVIVPNYKEPEEVLRRTLDGLAVQHRAKQRLLVVLAMEERESGAQAKGERIASAYEDRFASLVVSVHPVGMPDEVPGKSSNMFWATRALKQAVADTGADAALTTVTSCDADSVLHPSYFAAVSHLFAHDKQRYARFWQAPLLYVNNIWRVPAPVRFTTWFVHSAQIAELAMPFYVSLPISTYTLSMRLVEECGWWDPLVISEDWHTFLQCEVVREGDVGLTPVFLPTTADVAEGDGFWSGIRARHEQVMRHAWGAEDVGYLLGELRQGNCCRSVRMLARTGQVLHDHSFRVASWFLILSAYVLNFGNHPIYAAANGRAMDTIPQTAAIIGALFLTGGIMIGATLMLELRRDPLPPGVPVLKFAVELMFMWFLLPITGLYLGMIPALRAQTKMMFRRPFYYEVTLKSSTSVSDAA